MAQMPKYRRVADRIEKLIQDGVLGPGAALPAVRKLSRQWEVSISTVLTAYQRLEAAGLIRSMPRSGFYVSSRLPTTPPEPAVSHPEPDPSTVTMRELITLIILRDTVNPRLTQLGAAHPDPALCATAKLNRLMAAAARRQGNRSGLYLPPDGDPRLCREIARHSINAGCSLDPGQIMVTAGCGEAIYLSLKAICRPGDTVAVESPICFDVFQYMENLGLKALEIPTHPREGISLPALQFALDHHPVQACIVISNFNNPLGSCIPNSKKKELVALLADRRIPLIENDIFGDIHYRDQRPAAAKAHDTRGLVLWCASFSKALSPGLRVGWCAPGRFKEKIEWLKFSASLASATLPQAAVADFMAQGEYARHLKRIQRIYEQRMGGLRRAVFRYFPAGIRATDPRGGFLLWIELPGRVNALDLYKTALDQGIAITPGHLFSAGQQYHSFIRLNAANWSDTALPAIQRLGRAISDMIGPHHS